MCMMGEAAQVEKGYLGAKKPEFWADSQLE